MASNCKLVEEIKTKWDQCEENNPEVFRYKVNISRDKVLDGNFKFYVQVRRIFIILLIRDVTRGSLILAQH